MILAKKFSGFQTLLTEIQNLKVFMKKIPHVKAEVVALLRDSSNCTKQWQSIIIEEKSNFNNMNLDELE
jgi:hypothetical protein